jgi:hypothetical protein
MAQPTETDLYAVIGRLYVLTLCEQQEHNETRRALTEAQRAAEQPADPVSIAEARPQRKGG